MTVAATWFLIAGLYIAGWHAIRLMGRTPKRPPAKPYDWECESGCPDCNPPLDQRDVDLWCRQVVAANTDQIMNEVE